MSKYLLYGMFIQTLFVGLLLANTGNAQKESIHDIYIDISAKNLKGAIKEIERETDFSFTYNTEYTNLTIGVSIENGRKSLAEVLTILAKETGYNFSRINDNIHIVKREVSDAPSVVTEVYPQQVRISGQVTEADTGEPLPGVSILVKGTSSGTTTDMNGQYSLNAAEGDVLQFSYIGFLMQEKTVGNQTTLDISMQPDLEQLDEVVVVGYGSVSKSDLTGSVSSVKSEELTAFPTVDATQALQGRAAGVQITANNGAPGSAYKVRVRGGTSINASSDPIFVVDGLVGGVLPPPEDIASIEVLKDASATAIYGSRGANGVILVTTKRGSTDKTNISFSSAFSTQEEINRIDMLNASQFTDYITDANPNFDRYTGPNGETYNTDWQDEIFRRGAIQNYHLSVSGGTDKMKYYVSGVYYDQVGVIKNSDFSRYSITSNLDIQATDKLHMGINLFARRSNSDGVRTQESSGGSNNTGVVSSALLTSPTLPIFNPNGSFTRDDLNAIVDNPVNIVNNRINESSSDWLQANLFAAYDILPNLEFRTSLGFTSNNSRNGGYTATTTIPGENLGGIGSLFGSRNTVFLNENYFTYTKDLGDHNVTLVGGYSYQLLSNESWGSQSSGFVTDAVSFWDLDGGEEFLQPFSALVESEIASWYGRLNYSYKGKYLVTINGRYDGASNFSKNNKWAFFPSAAFAWNIKDEAFLTDFDAISDMKLRTSYGVTGNQAIAPYQTAAAFNNILSVQGGSLVNAVVPQRLANDDLTWETTTQWNVGLDISFLNNRLNVVADYYSMRTKDLLFGRPLPEIIGISNLEFTTNLGEVQNRGIELSISSVNVDKELKWTTDFNISANRNEVIQLPDGLDIFYSSAPDHLVGVGDTQILREGEPVGAFFGFQYDGVYQTGDSFLPGGGFEQQPGGERFVDSNGDGELTPDDRVIIGDPNPDFIWGLNNNFSWKGFDMNIFFQASQGNDLYSFTLLELDLNAANNNATTAALNRWTPNNTNTDVPAANSARARRSSSRFVRDGSFVRLRNISLGYTLPTTITEKLKISSMRVYVSGQNLLTFTDYEGFDPEVNYKTSGSVNGNRNLGLDYSSYPNAKGYTFGLNVNF